MKRERPFTGTSANSFVTLLDKLPKTGLQQSLCWLRLAGVQFHVELVHLGKVRTETVKRVSRELIRRFPERFTGNFESDKEAVNQLVLTQSKRLRNRIAGYVTRLKVVEAERAAATEAATEAPEATEPSVE